MRVEGKEGRYGINRKRARQIGKRVMEWGTYGNETEIPYMREAETLIGEPGARGAHGKSWK